MNKTILVLTGSKREDHQFQDETGMYDAIPVHGAGTMFGRQVDELHLYGTAHNRRDFDQIVSEAKHRGIRIIDHWHPAYAVVMPAMEIVHDYAGRLGISSEWRHRGKKSDSTFLSELG